MLNCIVVLLWIIAFWPKSLQCSEHYNHVNVLVTTVTLCLLLDYDYPKLKCFKQFSLDFICCLNLNESRVWKPTWYFLHESLLFKQKFDQIAIWATNHPHFPIELTTVVKVDHLLLVKTKTKLNSSNQCGFQVSYIIIFFINIQITNSVDWKKRPQTKY